ncbi:MAG: shikimate kinase, partial [Polyangiaceae bacterium]
MRSVCLSGFMATGKSTVGPIAAGRLGIPFVDTDVEIERQTGKPVHALWREEGEAAFRERERALLAALLAEPAPKVIALGGGAVTVEESRRHALDRAIVVTLTASPETVAARVGDARTRPNLMASGDPPARIRELLAQRAEAYAECHLELATDAIDPDAAADAVVALVHRDPLVVPLGRRSYGIDVCADQPTRLTDAVARLAPSSVVLVTDSNVHRARGAAIEAALHPLAARGTRVTLAPGEAHKTLASVGT